jgi:hypothetical protein
MTDAEAGETETEKSSPLPPKLTICGLLTALSVIVNEPVLAPAAVGVKLTVMAQLAPAAKLVPQVLICAKSPLVAMLVMVKAPVPVLFIVTV